MAHESLSALLDGECTPAEMEQLLREMESSPELKRQWSRLCLVREAREGTRIVRTQACICTDVMSKLGEMAEAPVHPNVVEMTSRSAPRRPLAWTRDWRGFAAAASVAAAAMLVAVPTQKHDALPSSNASSNGFVPQISTPVTFPFIRRSGRNLQSVALRPEDMAQQDELNRFMIEHNNTMADQGMGGTLRYARFAAHTAEYRPQAEPSAPEAVVTPVSAQGGDQP
jgi:negative regulator of sigma E activity